MLQLKITREEGLYYWAISRNDEIVCAGLRGFDSAAAAEAEARAEWHERFHSPECGQEFL